MKPLRRYRQLPKLQQAYNPKHRKAVATKVVAVKAVAALAEEEVVVVADLAADLVAAAVVVAVEAHAAKSARLLRILKAMSFPKKSSLSTVAPRS